MGDLIVAPRRVHMPVRGKSIKETVELTDSTGVISVTTERVRGGIPMNIIHMRMTRAEFFRAMLAAPGRLPEGFIGWNAESAGSGYSYAQMIEYLQKGSPQKFEAVEQTKRLITTRLSQHKVMQAVPHHSRGRVMGNRLRMGHPKPFLHKKERNAPGIINVSFENAIGGGYEKAFVQRGAALLALEEAAAIRGIPIRFIATFRNTSSVHGAHVVGSNPYSYKTPGSVLSGVDNAFNRLADFHQKRDPVVRKIQEANPRGTDVRVVMKQPGERILAGAVAFALSTKAMCPICEYGTISLAALHGGMITTGVGGQRNDALQYLPGERPSDLHVQPWTMPKSEAQVVEAVEGWIEALGFLDL